MQAINVHSTEQYTTERTNAITTSSPKSQKRTLKSSSMVGASKKRGKQVPQTPFPCHPRAHNWKRNRLPGHWCQRWVIWLLEEGRSLIFPQAWPVPSPHRRSNSPPSQHAGSPTGPGRMWDRLELCGFMTRDIFPSHIQPVQKLPSHNKILVCLGLMNSAGLTLTTPWDPAHQKVCMYWTRDS